MSNIFHLASGTQGHPHDPSRTARSGKLDAITAAMLTGGASSGWRMGRAFRLRAARDDGAPPQRRPDAADDGGRQQKQAA
jgi:hypothetical protein